jgi:hypothetical protein
MTSCEEMLERMPAVALGEAQWTDEEASHLAGLRQMSGRMVP